MPKLRLHISATSVLLLIAVLLLTLATGCGGGTTSRDINRETPPVVVTIAPGTASAVAGTGMTFTATVTNASNTAVTWSVQEGDAAGTISAGVFMPAKAGVFHIVATSMADNSKTAMATVTVTAPTPVFASQAPTAAEEGQAYSYTIDVNDAAKSALTFTLTDAPPGATLAGNTVNWTPASDQGRIATHFEVKVDTAAGGSARQSWTVTPTGTIRGLALWTYVTDTGDISDVPDTFDDNSFQVHIPTSTGYTTINASGNANGEMSALGVPAGYYWLQYGASYLWTDRSLLDLGGVLAGRQNLTTAAANTSLVVDLTDLMGAPLQGQDHIQVFTPGAGVLRDQELAGMSPGITTATVTFDWRPAGVYYSLPVNDQAYVTQLTTVNTGKPFHLLTRGALLPLNMTDAGVTNVFADVTSPAAEVSVPAKFAGTEWTALAAGVNPHATIQATNAYLGVQAYGNSHGALNWPNPRLASYYGEAGALGNADYGAFVAANPFPSEWPLLVDYDQQFGVPYDVPGATIRLSLICHIRTVTNAMPDGNGFSHPLLPPVIAPTINGQDFFLPQSNAGLTPTLVWAAPPGATGYIVMVLRVYEESGTPTIAGVATLRTSATSMTLPPGVLEAGNSYAIVIQAHSEPGADYGFAPYRHALPHGMAAAASGLITP